MVRVFNYVLIDTSPCSVCMCTMCSCGDMIGRIAKDSLNQQ